MAKTAEIRTRLTGDATGLRRELDVSRSDVARYARDVTERLKAIQAAAQSINIVASISGFIGIAKQAISVYNDLRKWIRGTSEEAEKAAAAATEAARKMRDEAAKSGVDTSLYDVLREQAEKAGVAADELSEKLKQFREHKLTFDELAASIGGTRDAIESAANAADKTNVGRRYLAERGDREARAATAAEAAENERQGLRAIVRDIARLADKFGNGGQDVAALWDRLLEAAGGDAAKAADIYNANRSVLGRAVGVGMYGDEALRAASGRYAGNMAARAARRQAAIDAADAEARRARERGLEAKIREGTQEYNPYQAYAEEQRAAAAAAAEARKAAESEAGRQRRIEDLEAKQVDVRWRAQRAEEAVRVSAPSAINSYNAVGGLVGADPTAMNAMRMEAERARAVEDIRGKLVEALRALQTEIDILREG